jgi:hypothetical protein
MRSYTVAVARFSLVPESLCIIVVTVDEVSARTAPRTNVLYLFGDGTARFESVIVVSNKTD